MTKYFVLAWIMLISLLAESQVNNLKIGYQEFPTTIAGHASDEAGNMYYSGSFTGQLTVNDKVLENGRGVEDIFIVKTEAGGRVLHATTFGSKQKDGSVANGLCYANNSLYLAASVTDDIAFQSYPVAAYRYSTNYNITNCIVSLDTAGNAKWVNKTSLTITSIFADRNIVHVLGQATSAAGAVRYNSRILYDSSGSRFYVHLMLDTAGNLINYKRIAPRASSLSEINNLDYITYADTFSDGKICMLVTVSGNQSFQFGSKTITLPSASKSHLVLIKTDTAYANVSSKVLNDGATFSDYVSSAIPISLSKKDSVYMILSSNPPASLVYDNLYIGLNARNVLVVLDSALKAKRVVDLGPSDYYDSTSPFPTKRIVFRGIAAGRDNLVFSGIYTGPNVTPSNDLVPQDTLLRILPNLYATADFNGISKSFVANTSYDFSTGSFNWIGDLAKYEYSIVDPLYFHLVKDSLIAFAINRDNTWNPWILDKSLHVVTGSMKFNADGADIVKFVEYLPDGSRFIMGTVRGKTLLDSSGSNYRSSFNRRDLFLARIAANGEVKWYKRFNSTYQSQDPLKLVIKGYKAYFLASLNSGGNKTNTIQIGNKLYTASATCLLASVDTSGNIDVINLENNLYGSVTIRDFSLFSNGDIICYSTLLGGMVNTTFSSANGYYLFRIARDSHALLATRRFAGGRGVMNQNFHNVETAGNDTIYLTSMLSYTGPPEDEFSKLVMYDGAAPVDSITVRVNVAGRSQGGIGIAKMTLNKFFWYKRTTGMNGLGITGPMRILPVNNKLYVSGSYNPYIMRSSLTGLYWDSLLVYPRVDFNKTYLFRLDANGTLERKNVLDGFLAGTIKSRGDDKLFLMGTINAATTIDTLPIGFDGATDAVSIVTDTGFSVKRVIRFASPYTETMLDMDSYRDSIATFAYTAQVEPVLKDLKSAGASNREAKMSEDVVATDFPEVAFMGSVVLKSAVILPVKLLTFDAQRSDNVVSVSWKVQSDESSQFNLQRAYNGFAFKTIASKIAYRVANPVIYITTDNLQEYGLYYYRLELVSMDGKTTYSNTVPIRYFTGKTAGYYDHAGQQFHIIRSIGTSYEYKLLDGSGKVVAVVQGASGNKVINLSSQPTGLYIVQIMEKEGGSVQSFKFVK